MGKYENTLKYMQLAKLLEEGNYEAALDMAGTFDTDRTREVQELKLLAEVYKKNELYDRAKDMYKLIYEQISTRRILYRLIILCIKSGDVKEASSLYQEYLTKDKNSIDRYTLKYSIDKAAGADVSIIIEDLKAILNEEYSEKWAYELARQYHKTGNATACVEECRKIVQWFFGSETAKKAALLGQYYTNELDEDILGTFQESISADVNMYMQQDKEESAVTETAEGYAAHEAPEEYAAPERPEEYAAHEAPEEYVAPERPEEYAAHEAPEEYVAPERPAEYTVPEKPVEAAAEYADPVMPVEDAVSEELARQVAAIKAAAMRESAEPEVPGYSKEAAEPEVPGYSKEVAEPEVPGQSKEAAESEVPKQPEAPTDAFTEITDSDGDTPEPIEGISKYGQDIPYTHLKYLFKGLAAGVKPPVNIAIAATEPTYYLTVAKKITKELQNLKYFGDRKIKIAKIDAQKLNALRFDEQVSGLVGSCVMIENASAMSAQTINSIIRVLDSHSSEIVIILVDEEEALSKMLFKEEILKNQIKYFVIVQ